MGKRALLLQNIFKLISQEISVDLALCNDRSRPVVCGGDGRTERRRSGLPLLVINRSPATAFGVNCMKERERNSGRREKIRRTHTESQYDSGNAGKGQERMGYRDR